VLPELLPLAIVVIALSAVVVFFLVRGFKPPPRGDSLPASVPIALSEPDLERFAAAAADCLKTEDPKAEITASSIVDAIKSGRGEVKVAGMFDEHVAFRLDSGVGRAEAGYRIIVDRAGKLVSVARA
jgi:hypothetical protein